MIRRLRFIGHCWRKKDEVISDLLLWEPKHGARKRGRPALTYVDQLQNDTGLSIVELKNIMENWKEWMKLVNGVRVRSKSASKQLHHVQVVVAVDSRSGSEIYKTESNHSYMHSRLEIVPVWRPEQLFFPVCY